MFCYFSLWLWLFLPYYKQNFYLICLVEIHSEFLEQNSVPRKQLALTLGRGKGRTWNGNREVSNLYVACSFLLL